MFKQLLKNLIILIITLEAKLVLWRYRPKIIAVTGSVGKTSAKDAIATVLGQKFFVRKSTKSYNSEIGVPLVILGIETGWLNPFIWLNNILKGLKLLFSFKKIKYPEWLILEMGVERPGDMKKLASWIKPDIVVLTALAEIPPHVEFFAGPEELIREKMSLIQRFDINRFVILNGDDKTLCEAKSKIQAKVISFGFNEDVNLRASNYHITYRKDETTDLEIPEGITFKVDYEGSSVPVRIFGAFGKHHVYSALAALGAGLAQDFNLIDAGEALFRYKPPPGRLKLIEGVKNTYILDDTYNASPLAVHAALDV
jgi:UDP-N-acetylmuramoyl-tripeptide--D-alanyl-D-alanine ligase